MPECPAQLPVQQEHREQGEGQVDDGGLLGQYGDPEEHAGEQAEQGAAPLYGPKQGQQREQIERQLQGVYVDRDRGLDVDSRAG